MKKGIFFALFVLLIAPAAFAQSSDPVKRYISVQSDTLALTHAKIVDGTGGPSKANQTLTIIRGMITMLGNSANVKIPAHAKVIDCRGKTIMPGMIMMHSTFVPAGSPGRDPAGDWPPSAAGSSLRDPAAMGKRLQRFTLFDGLNKPII